MKKIISVLMTFFLCVSISVCAVAASPKTFKIGITDYTPMNYYDYNGELIGFDTELAKYVSEKLGMVPEFIHIDWSCKEIELNTENIDCVWNALTYTDDRAEVMDLSYPYAKSSYVMIAKKENVDNYKKLDTMSGLTFVVENDTNEEWIAEDYGLNFFTEPTLPSALQDIRNNRADAGIVYGLSANKLLNNNYSDLAVVHTFSEEKFCVATKKNSIYTSKINEALSMAKADEFLAELSSKYSVDVCWDEIPDIYSKDHFTDVPSNHWAYDYICEMSENGIITGYGNGTFGPENSITRAQFATMLCRFANIDTSSITNTAFSDISMSDWYAPYVEAVKPYLKGYNNNSYYNPNTYAKREDIAEALVKYKGYDVSDYNEDEFKTFFVDWNEIHVDARKYVYAAVKNNLISGYSDKTFRSEANITRAEAATLFYKLSR